MNLTKYNLRLLQDEVENKQKLLNQQSLHEVRIQNFLQEQIIPSDYTFEGSEGGNTLAHSSGRRTYSMPFTESVLPQSCQINLTDDRPTCKAEESYCHTDTLNTSTNVTKTVLLPSDITKRLKRAKQTIHESVGCIFDPNNKSLLLPDNRLLELGGSSIFHRQPVPYKDGSTLIEERDRASFQSGLSLAPNSKRQRTEFTEALPHLAIPSNSKTDLRFPKLNFLH
ncbi:hypothetical protein BON22_2891 [Cyberlindnera fabianii]|uniref:Uncharacterized protein n=1 Tax=Cyberlindnera fabianii TaxID=36022 RepID=A0A1V2L878_CYBFA|nr:hypothetical protein BON22_2891 [Cyberlindnera fabianii]